jgi:transketolase
VREPEALSMREAAADALNEFFAEFDNLVVLDADVSKSTRTVKFGQAHPERFLNVGIAEANMVGIAAGLATCGMLPVVNSFSMLLSMRTLDQVRQSVAYPRLDVKFAAHYGGLSAGPEGPTHHACEDLGIVRSVPNMTVLVPCDATEAREALRATLEYSGPVYLRISRNPLPQVHKAPRPFRVGEGYELRPGRDVAIAAMGAMVVRALDAAEDLAREGLDCRVVAMPTLKPLDRGLVERCARETGAIVTAEEHNILNGLGSAVAETICETHPVPMERVGIHDRFAESGDYFALMEKYGLAVADIVAAVHRAVARKVSPAGPGKANTR